MIRTLSRHRPGFTLIELLVVIAIIAVLIALLLPGVQRMHEASNRTQCAFNLKQIGQALQNYNVRYQKFPSGFYTGNPSSIYQQTGWQLQLLPYLDQTNLWTQSVTYLTANTGNTDTNNYPAANCRLSTFNCPTNLRPLTYLNTTNGFIFNVSMTSYMGCSGTVSNSPSPGGFLYYNSAVTLDQITDGPSKTIAVGERPASGNLYWGWGFAPYGYGFGDGDTVLGSNDAYLAVLDGDKSTNVGLQPQSYPNDTNTLDSAHYWSYHPGGAEFLFCDGSVQFLTYNANNVFPQLCTIAGGEQFTMPF